MSTEILSDANPSSGAARVTARSVPYSDLDLRFKAHPHYGDIVPLKDLAAVKASVRNILLTNPGERPFQPEFGCNTWAYLFEQADPVTLSFLEDEIRDAIARHEPRVVPTQVNVRDDTDSNALHISVTCVLVSSREEIDVGVQLERTR